MTTKATRFYKETIEPGIRKFCEENGLEYSNSQCRGFAFQQWVANLIADHDGNVNKEEIDDNMLTSQDGGVDFILNDDNNRCCYVVQTKCTKNISTEDIRGFFAIHDELVNGKFLDKKNLADTARDLLSEYKVKIEDGWTATWIFSTIGKCPEVDLNIYEDIECCIYDSSRMENIYKESQSQTESIPDNVSFDIPRDKFIEFSSPRKTLIAVIKGNALRNVYEKYKESLLAYNIRKFMGERGINKEIKKTAEEEPRNFFYFNNGISAICTTFKVTDNKVFAEKFQIINGGQTYGSLYKAGSKEDVQVLLRLTEGEGVVADKGFNAQVIKYNNTQNAIKDSDFRSNDRIQNYIKKNFSELKKPGALGKKIDYHPKRSGKKAKSGYQKLTLEEFAKILGACKINPCVSVESPKQLWDIERYYKTIFGPTDDIWTQEDFNRNALTLAFYFSIQAKIKRLNDEAKEKAKEENNPNDPNKYVYLRRLKYHILGLSHIFIKHHNISPVAWQKKITFDETFSKFWVGQNYIVSPIKREAETAKDAKGLYNIVRNLKRWDDLSSNYTNMLNSQ